MTSGWQMATILSVNLGPYSLDLKLSHIHSGIQVSVIAAHVCKTSISKVTLVMKVI